MAESLRERDLQTSDTLFDVAAVHDLGRFTSFENSMWLKVVQYYWKHALVFVSLGILCVAVPVLIQRGLHGEYGFGIHGFSILFWGLFPFMIVVFVRRYQVKYSSCVLCTLALFLSTCLVLCYLSSNGLWCAQHSKITHEMCAKLLQFASFAASSNVTSWWLTLGDLLAIQRGRVMPMAWEHDVDVCITPDQFPVFEKALKSRAGHFHPNPQRQEPGHWYLPIDMIKLGLRAREAEGVSVDIWTCPRSFTGNITRVLYCNGFMNVPDSWKERHSLLTKHYGDYSVVKYEHHDTMCRLWNG